LMDHSAKRPTKLPGRRCFARRQLPPLILMTDDVRLADPLPAVTRLPRGCAVLLRHYADPNRAKLARALVPLCRRHGIKLLIAGDARLAAAVGADGFHLPEAMLRRGCRRWQAWRKPHWIVTAAAHSRASLRAAARLGADAALLSPVFHTASHPDAAALGVLKFARWAGESPVPVYALGGIGAHNGRRLAGSGIVGIAGISGLMAEKPAGP
ncbi:MAG: thiamine phosphate synthase, partial [Rhodospirillales bacterium]